MMIAPVSRATLPNDSVEGPGISSASAKLAWSSDWQKYCDRKSSGRQIICAPCRAASRTRVTAFAKFAAGSGPHCICTSATLVLDKSGMLPITIEEKEGTADHADGAELWEKNSTVSDSCNPR